MGTKPRNKNSYIVTVTTEDRFKSEQVRKAIRDAVEASMDIDATKVTVIPVGEK